MKKRHLRGRARPAPARRDVPASTRTCAPCSTNGPRSSTAARGRAGKGVRRAHQDRRRGARALCRARRAADLVRHHRRELCRARGGLGALSLVKDAKKALEQALEIDPRALDGSAYTSLGSLYYQVPGLADRLRQRREGARAPAEGARDQSRGHRPELFPRRLPVPQGRLRRCAPGARQGAQGAAAPDRALADEGRRKEIEALLAAMR